MALPTERASADRRTVFLAAGNRAGAGDIDLISDADIATGLHVRVVHLTVSMAAAGTCIVKDGSTELATLHFAQADSVSMACPDGVFETSTGKGVNLTLSGDGDAFATYLIEEV